MFPWLAFGHMLPYLQLSKLIASKGHKISFISTPRNIDRLPYLPQHLSTLITFVKLPLPHHNPNLPECSEATADVSIEQVPYLKNPYDSLKEPLTHFLKASKPDWILFDFAPYWLPEIARGLGVRTGFNSILMAVVLAFVQPTSPEFDTDDRKVAEDYTVPLKWMTFPTTVAWRLFEIIRLFDQVTGEGITVSDEYRVMETLRGCDLIVVRSCVEFEAKWLKLLEGLHGKRVFLVGVLSPVPEDEEDDESWRSIKEWMDRQRKKTVVYVAFGTESLPTHEEATEIALGLEKSGLPKF